MANYDVIVIGLGGMGSAAAMECARRGLRVLGLEQFPLVHDRGSSHGQTRVIRQAYYEHPDYVPLLKRAYDRWYQLEQDSGQHLYTPCGVLSLSPPGGEVVAGVSQAAHQHGLNVDSVSADDVRRRYPEFQLPDSYQGIYEVDAGFLYVEECVRAHLHLARHWGATLHSEETVHSWKDTGSSVEVVTDSDRYHADRLIVTAGSWTSRILNDLGLPLQVLRKPLLWFGTANPSRFRRDRFPIYMVETPGGFYYGFPVVDERGHKLARHDGGELVPDPEKLDRQLNSNDEQECREFLDHHLPGVSGPLRHYDVCMYTVTPDRHFILDRHPHSERVVMGAGFSGHGFKFASVVGEILTDLALQGHSALPIQRFGLERFGVSS